MDEALTSYLQSRANHLHLADAYCEVRNIHRLEGQEQVVLLVGATGAGKTVLLSKLRRDCLQDYLEDMRADPGFVPTIMQSLTSPTPTRSGHQNFDWKDAFIRLLRAGHDILLSNKVLPRMQIELDGETLNGTGGLQVAALRRAMEQFAHTRRLRLLLLDEASHIFASNRAGSDYPLHFDMLKSMSGSIGCPLVLAGAYDLLEALELNGQLNRRIKVIHLRRYTPQDLAQNTAHGQSFRNLVYTFVSRSPIPLQVDPVESCDYFLLKSLGSVGLLKQWLDRALFDAWERQDSHITRETLRRHELSNRRLKKILDEIKLGEKALEDIGDEVLARGMGMASTPSLDSADPDTALSRTPSKIKKKGTRVGKRAPSRDPVGGSVDAST